MSTILSLILAAFQGKKTYIAAIGLFGLGVYQLSIGDVAGFQSLLGGFAALGLRSAVAQVPVATNVQIQQAVESRMAALRPPEMVVIRPPAPADQSTTTR